MVACFMRFTGGSLLVTLYSLLGSSRDLDNPTRKIPTGVSNKGGRGFRFIIGNAEMLQRSHLWCLLSHCMSAFFCCADVAAFCFTDVAEDDAVAASGFCSGSGAKEVETHAAGPGRKFTTFPS